MRKFTVLLFSLLAISGLSGCMHHAVEVRAHHHPVHKPIHHERVIVTSSPYYAPTHIHSKTVVIPKVVHHRPEYHQPVYHAPKHRYVKPRKAHEHKKVVHKKIVHKEVVHKNMHHEKYSYKRPHDVKVIHKEKRVVKEVHRDRHSPHYSNRLHKVKETRVTRERRNHQVTERQKPKSVPYNRQKESKERRIVEQKKPHPRNRHAYETTDEDSRYARR